MLNFPATSAVCPELPPASVATSIPSILLTASRCLTPKAPCPANAIFIRRSWSCFILEDDVPDRGVRGRHVVEPVDLAHLLIQGAAHDQPHDELNPLGASLPDALQVRH